MFNVLDWNDRAIKFYRRIGATFLDDWKKVCLEQKALHELASEEGKALLPSFTVKCDFVNY